MGTLAARLTLLASGVCIVAAVLALYARSAILDPGHFADRAVGTLAQDEVADEIAARFSDDVIGRSPRLVTMRPALESAATRVATTPQFATAFGAGVRELQRGIFTGSDSRPALRVPGMAAQVRAAVAGGTPSLARRLPADGDVQLMSIGSDARERTLLDVAARARWPTWLAPIALLLGVVGLLLVALDAPDRRRGVWASGLTLAGAGGALTAGWIGARTLTLEHFDTGWGDAIVKTIWGAYLGDLRTWSLCLAGAGIVVAAASARPEHATRLTWAQVPPQLSGSALLLAGAVVLADRDLALDLLAAAAAGVLLYLGARQVLAGQARIALASVILLVLTTAVAVAVT